MNRVVARQSNFELLRIIAMAMIVGLHYFNGTMGGALSQLSSGDFNYYTTHFFESMFIVGVNCFILITGYFQIEKTSIKLNKVIELLIQMVFYGLLFYLLAVSFGWVSFSIIEMVKAMVPFLVGLKWFIKIYIILYLLIPFINAGLNKMDKKGFQTFLIIMILFFSIYPSFLPSPPVTDNGYGIITFVLMYALGGYIKKFYVPNRSKKFYLSGFILCGIITFAFSVIVPMVMPAQLVRVWGYNFIFNVFGALFLFLFFSKLKIKSTKINYISSFTLGVYFVHTDPSIYHFVYKNILHTDNFWFSPLFIVHVFISIFIVYMASTFVDVGRMWIFERMSKFILPFFKKHFPILWKQIP